MFFVTEDNVCDFPWWDANAQMSVVEFNRFSHSASRKYPTR